jgi:neuralized-like protein 4
MFNDSFTVSSCCRLQVRIESLSSKWSGSMLIGLTTAAMTDPSAAGALPACAADLRTKSSWIVRRSEVLRNGVVVHENYCPSLERLTVDNRIGVMRATDGTMHVFVNDCDFGIAASDIPRVSVFAESFDSTSFLNFNILTGAFRHV